MSCTIREAKQRVTSSEFSEWCAFYDLFPWDYGTAYLATLITNMMRAEGKPPIELSQHMPADFVPADPLAAFRANLKARAVNG
jgi:hypothetical protein